MRYIPKLCIKIAYLFAIVFLFKFILADMPQTTINLEERQAPISQQETLKDKYSNPSNRNNDKKNLENNTLSCKKKYMIFFLGKKNFLHSFEDLNNQNADCNVVKSSNFMISKSKIRSSIEFPQNSEKKTFSLLSKKDSIHLLHRNQHGTFIVDSETLNGMKRSELQSQNEILYLSEPWTNYFQKGYSLLDINRLLYPTKEDILYLPSEINTNLEKHTIISNLITEEIKKLLLWSPIDEDLISRLQKSCELVNLKCEIVHKLRWMNAVSIFASLVEEPEESEECQLLIEKKLENIMKNSNDFVYWKKVESLVNIKDLNNQNLDDLSDAHSNLKSDQVDGSKLNSNQNKKNKLSSENDIPDIQYVDHIENDDIHVENPHFLNKYGSEEDELTYGESAKQLKLIKISDLHRRGLSGRNVTILLLDSGFDWRKHEALKDISIKHTWDFVKGDSIVWNEEGDDPQQILHGSKVLGLLAGKSLNRYYGAAFNSDFLLAKTEDVKSETKHEEDNFVAALEWGMRLGADLMSASLGYSFSLPDGKSSISTIGVNAAIELGLTCVIAAGNYGTQGFGSIVTPSDAYLAISVGAVDSNQKRGSFSSLGPTRDNRIKPEVVAYGVSNYVVDPNSYSSYLTGSGTSFATPLVAGSIAQLMERYPSWKGKPKYVRSILLRTSQNIWVGEEKQNNYFGYGLLNALNALQIGCESNTCILNYCQDGRCNCGPDYNGLYCRTSNAFKNWNSSLLKTILFIISTLLVIDFI